MSRAKTIESINDFLKDANKESKIKLTQLIYTKYPDFVLDKGGGIQIKIKKIPTQFLETILQEVLVSDIPEEFWQTLI